MVEFDVLSVTTGTRGILSADNNTANERIELYASAADPKAIIVDGGATQADLDAGTLTANTAAKFGLSYAANDIAICLDSGTVQTDVAASMPTPDRLRIGVNQAAGYLSGHSRSLQFYSSAKYRHRTSGPDGMICYVGAAQNEKQAMNAIKKYGKWTVPDPANPDVDVLWNGAVAMIAGCKLIVGYQGSVPVYHGLYWMNLLSPVPDDVLYNDVANLARAPIIEFDFTMGRDPPLSPSDFVRRMANLPPQLLPLDDKVLGITPIWAGSPNMGWLYNT